VVEGHIQEAVDRVFSPSTKTSTTTMTTATPPTANDDPLVRNASPTVTKSKKKAPTTKKKKSTETNDKKTSKTTSTTPTTISSPQINPDNETTKDITVTQPLTISKVDEMISSQPNKSKNQEDKPDPKQNNDDILKPSPKRVSKGKKASTDNITKKKTTQKKEVSKDTKKKRERLMESPFDFLQVQHFNLSQLSRGSNHSNDDDRSLFSDDISHLTLPVQLRDLEKEYSKKKKQKMNADTDEVDEEKTVIYPSVMIAALLGNDTVAEIPPVIDLHPDDTQHTKSEKNRSTTNSDISVEEKIKGVESHWSGSSTVTSRDNESSSMVMKVGDGASIISQVRSGCCCCRHHRRRIVMDMFVWVCVCSCVGESVVLIKPHRMSFPVFQVGRCNSVLVDGDVDCGF